MVCLNMFSNDMTSKIRKHYSFLKNNSKKQKWCKPGLSGEVVLIYIALQPGKMVACVKVL